MEKTVVELFAGVGGFRVAFNEVKLSKNKLIEKNNFDFIWANQWEPNENKQHAFTCYVTRFGKNKNHVNENISLIDKNTIPKHTVLVGGFPCQDYSVARTISGEKGIEGKKGILWWEIKKIIEKKLPPFVLLENVDRLLKSPSKQRGRDFGIMLRTLHDLEYFVEWRVINASDYGHVQRRRRVLIFASHKKTNYYKKIHKTDFQPNKPFLMFDKAFPISKRINMMIKKISTEFFKDLVDISINFKADFRNSGYLMDGQIVSYDSIPIITKYKALKSILEKEIKEDYYYTFNEDKIIFLKGKKKILRNKNGINYYYSEGSIPFPDDLEQSARTMLTSEGSTNRSTHFVIDLKTHKIRKLTPIECERINEFPDNWTNTGMPNSKRYFMMGNALVVGIIQKISKELIKIIEKEN
jgi:DNA (cytosine-5)-methyltransferase 1